MIRSRRARTRNFELIALTFLLTTVASGISAWTRRARGSPFFFALSVSDVEESVRWYSRVLGFNTTRSIDLESRGIRIRLLKRHGGFLELAEVAGAVDLGAIEPGIRRRQHLHGVFKIGFQVQNLDGAVSRLDALGVTLRGKAVTESDGSMRSAQVLDPDGNIIQIFEIL